MNGKYDALLQLYKKSPNLFQRTIEKIRKSQFCIFTLNRILDSRNRSEVEAARRILVTIFHDDLTNKELLAFQACSGDSVTQNMIATLFEERMIKKENLFDEADRIVALFSS